MTAAGGLLGPSTELLCDFCSIFCSAALDEIATEVTCGFAGQRSPGGGILCLSLGGEKVTLLGGALGSWWGQDPFV